MEAKVVCVGRGEGEGTLLLLQNVTLQVDKEDRWLWNLEKSYAYSVRSAYNSQSAQPVVVTPVDVNMLWQKHIPLKVVVFG